MTNYRPSAGIEGPPRVHCKTCNYVFYWVPNLARLWRAVFQSSLAFPCIDITNAKQRKGCSLAVFARVNNPTAVSIFFFKLVNHNLLLNMHMVSKLQGQSTPPSPKCQWIWSIRSNYPSDTPNQQAGKHFGC